MQCSDARVLMDRRLDGEGAPGLDAHLEACESCARSWSELVAVHEMLCSQELMEPPRHFRSRALNRIETRLRRLPDWQRSLLQIGSIVTGAATLGAIGLLALRGWRLTALGAAADHVAGTAAGIAGVFGRATLSAVQHGPAMWPVYAALALAMALVWFGVLVVPRVAAAARTHDSVGGPR